MAGRKRKYPQKLLVELYRNLYMIRVFETRCIKLYRQGLIRGYFHPYLGEEAIAVGVCAALRPKDRIASTHRGHGHCIARGADIKLMAAEIMGRETGYCGGRGGSMHIADMSLGNLGANGIVGANMPLALGSALGSWVRGTNEVTVAFTSDGGVMNGTFCETLNLAGALGVPLIVVIENNQYAVSTTVEETTRETELYKRGIGLGVESHRIDGNNVLEVYDYAKDAHKKCVQGKGPVLLEAVTYRHGGHHVNDPGLYMPKDRLEDYKKKDPCLLGRKFLAEIGAVTAQKIDEIERKVEQQMEEAVEYAVNSPQPSVEEFLDDVRCYS